MEHAGRHRAKRRNAVRNLDSGGRPHREGEREMSEKCEAKERNMQHTPGPWKPYVMTHADRGDLLTPEELGEYVKNSVIKSAQESGSAEFVFISADKPDGPADVCHVGNGPTRKANAYLIAAAPDLYLALDALREDYERLCGDGLTDANIPDVLRRALMALSSAEGRRAEAPAQELSTEALTPSVGDTPPK
jgi:hypothetical protein